MARTLTIHRWNETFENADTRKRERLKSFHAPSGLESRGYLALVGRFPKDKAMMAFGVFQALCQLSATFPSKARGSFKNSDGEPMELQQIAMLLRLEICHLEEAFEILTDKRVGWLRWVGDADESATHLPPICHPSPGFVQGEGEGEVEGTEREREADAAARDLDRTIERQAQHIVRQYARQEKTMTAIEIVAKHLRDGADPAAMEAGTRAISAKIATLPSGTYNRYVPSAESFFIKKRWADDPETFVRLMATPDKTPPGTITENLRMD